MPGMWSPTARVYWALAAIVAAGAGLRLYALDAQSLWNDEAVSLTVARASLSQMPGFFRSDGVRLPFEYNPPVYAYLLHGWLALVGVGDHQARLLSAVAGIAALPLLFVLVRRLYDDRAALCATMLLAVSQLGVMYSQEARHYAVFLLFVLLTVYFFWLAMTLRSLAAWCACTTAAVLMVGTQYYGAFVILALAIFTALYWRSIPLRWVAGLAVVSVAALVPWLLFALAGQMSAASDREQPEYFAFSLSTIASTINRFNNGGLAGLLDSAPAWTFPVGLVLFGGPVGLLLARTLRQEPGGPSSRSDRRAIVLPLLLFAVPLASVFFLAAVLNVQYNVRYVVFCIAPYYILVGAGLARLPGALLRGAALMAVLGYSGYALTANYRVPYKENYRDAIRFVTAAGEPQDCYAFVPFGGPPLQWALYAPAKPLRRLALEDERSDIAGCRRIWVITYQRVILDAHARWREWLTTRAGSFTRIADRSFHWVRVELYAAGQ